MLTLPIHSTGLGCNFCSVSSDLNKGWSTFINKIDSVMGRFNVDVQMKSKKPWFNRNLWKLMTLDMLH